MGIKGPEDPNVFKVKIGYDRIASQHYGFRYHICVTVLIYFLPLLVIGYAYTMVGITLWASEIPGDSSDRYHEQVSAKRKVVKMMIVVVCTFAICWLPFHIFFLLPYINPDLYMEKFIQQVYLAIMWLAMSSTMYNPIIYCCLNDRFRIGFKHAFRCCPFINATEYEGLEMKSTRYLQTQGSMYKVNRIETTVSSVVGVNEDELEDGSKAKRLSLDLTSNGSSRSDSKTMSESFSCYSNTIS
ncbi:substance-P receptor [Gracilinanus agilis]|uniref:substance-P receptor n=1 Tax=Gracilinanus agilis TaxID=191870 RepID=UPI001CFD4413|nr:substance-P receptor [Gracilinanus agilis]